MKRGNSIPETATNRLRLNENQKNVLLTAARHPDVDDASELQRYAEIGGLSLENTSDVLREHWPERHWDEPAPDIEITADEVDEMRRRLCEGCPPHEREIADEMREGITTNLLMDYAFGNLRCDGGNPEYPELERRGVTKAGVSWQPVESETHEIVE